MVEQEVVNNMLQLGAMVGLGAWALWERIQKARIQKASTDASVAVSDTTEQMFKLMTARLAALEADYSSLRAELIEERKHSRSLDMRVQQYQIHMMKLEALMRDKGLTPPPFELTI